MRKDLKTITYYAKGMHCAACEILLEKELKRLSTVVSVKASTANNQIDVTYQHAKPDLDLINKRISPHGYYLSEEPVNNDNQIITFNKRRGLQINSDNLFNFFYSLVFAGVVLLLFKFISGNGLGVFNVNQTSSLSAFFIFGLVAGLSTCAALVGGLLISLSKYWQDQYGSSSIFTRSHPHILFHGGRLVGYAFFGGLLGLLGSSIGITTIYNNSPITVTIISLVSLIMIFYGLELLGFNWAMKLLPKMPKAISHRIAGDNNSRFGRSTPFIIGALTFFLPCGFTVIAQGLALASGSLISGALIMTFFAAGTIFPLSIISISGLSISGKSQYGALFSYTLGIILLFFGFFNLSNQANILGLKIPGVSITADSRQNQQLNLPEIDGKQILETYADSDGYSPSPAYIMAQKPTVWKIVNNGVSGCTGGIISRDLFGGTVQLLNNVTEINLPALKPGRYSYSCWMGMYGGEIVAQ